MVALSGISSAAAAESVAHEIPAGDGRALPVGSDLINVTLSLGVALAGKVTIGTLLRKADRALYRARPRPGPVVTLRASEPPSPGIDRAATPALGPGDPPPAHIQPTAEEPGHEIARRLRVDVRQHPPDSGSDRALASSGPVDVVPVSGATPEVVVAAADLLVVGDRRASAERSKSRSLRVPLRPNDAASTVPSR